MVNKAEAMANDMLHWGTCKRYHGLRGGLTFTPIVFRRTGKTKTWVTRPDNFRVPVKRGLRNSWEITHDNGHEFHTIQSCKPTEIYAAPYSKLE